MTRNEFLNKHNETLMNNFILPIIKESNDRKQGNKVSFIALLYGCGRYSSTEALLKLLSLLKDDQWSRLLREFGENGF